MTEESAAYWLNKYSENRSIKGLLQMKIKNKNPLISEKKTFREYKILFNKLIKAKEILQLEGLTPGIKKVDEFITSLTINNPKFSG